MKFQLLHRWTDRVGEWIRYSLKRKCLHFDEIFITGCTGSCQNDNFQCSQWLKFRQNDDIFVSVFYPTLYNGCKRYLFMLGLKLNHVNKNGICSKNCLNLSVQYCILYSRTIKFFRDSLNVNLLEYSFLNQIASFDKLQGLSVSARCCERRTQICPVMAHDAMATYLNGYVIIWLIFRYWLHRNRKLSLVQPVTDVTEMKWKSTYDPTIPLPSAKDRIRSSHRDPGL